MPTNFLPKQEPNLDPKETSVLDKEKQLETAPQQPEVQKEAQETQGDEKQKQEGYEISAPTAVPASVKQQKVVPVTKDEMTKQIEGILEDDLTDLFLEMTPGEQRAFKIQGEETASKIREIVASAKISSRKIIGLIKEWLKLIPGVNKFFLEQEAKIKTDNILDAVEDQKERDLNI